MIRQSYNHHHHHQPNSPHRRHHHGHTRQSNGSSSTNSSSGNSTNNNNNNIDSQLNTSLQRNTSSTNSNSSLSSGSSSASSSPSTSPSTSPVNRNELNYDHMTSEQMEEAMYAQANNNSNNGNSSKNGGRSSSLPLRIMLNGQRTTISCSFSPNKNSSPMAAFIGRRNSSSVMMTMANNSKVSNNGTSSPSFRSTPTSINGNNNKSSSSSSSSKFARQSYANNHHQHQHQSFEQQNFGTFNSNLNTLYLNRNKYSRVSLSERFLNMVIKEDFMKNFYDDQLLDSMNRDEELTPQRATSKRRKQTMNHSHTFDDIKTHRATTFANRRSNTMPLKNKTNQQQQPRPNRLFENKEHHDSTTTQTSNKTSLKKNASVESECLTSSKENLLKLNAECLQNIKRNDAKLEEENLSSNGKNQQNIKNNNNNEKEEPKLNELVINFVKLVLNESLNRFNQEESDSHSNLKDDESKNQKPNHLESNENNSQSPIERVEPAHFECTDDNNLLDEDNTSDDRNDDLVFSLDACNNNNNNNKIDEPIVNGDHHQNDEVCSTQQQINNVDVNEMNGDVVAKSDTNDSATAQKQANDQIVDRQEKRDEEAEADETTSKTELVEERHRDIEKDSMLTESIKMDDTLNSSACLASFSLGDENNDEKSSATNSTNNDDDESSNLTLNSSLSKLDDLSKVASSSLERVNSTNEAEFSSASDSMYASSFDDEIIKDIMPKKSCLVTKSKLFIDTASCNNSSSTANGENGIYTANATSSPLLSSPQSPTNANNSSIVWSSWSSNSFQTQQLANELSSPTTQASTSELSSSSLSTTNGGSGQGTAAAKKRVLFADSCGKELFTVRTMSEPSNCPPKLTSKIVQYFLNREFNGSSQNLNCFNSSSSSSTTASSTNNSLNASGNSLSRQYSNDLNYLIYREGGFFSSSRMYDYGISALNYTNDVNQLSGSIAVYSLNFAQPAGDYLKFRKHLEENFVSLENVLLNQFQINGTIKVKNINYHKQVFVRCSFNGWKTYEDYPAVYVSSDYYSSSAASGSPQSSSATFYASASTNYQPQHKEYDTFRFEFQLPKTVDHNQLASSASSPQLSGSTTSSLFHHSASQSGGLGHRIGGSSSSNHHSTASIQFCICYRTGQGSESREFWDSNSGNNYEILQYVIDIEKLKPSTTQRQQQHKLPSNVKTPATANTFFKYESTTSGPKSSIFNSNSPIDSPCEGIYY